MKSCLAGKKNKILVLILALAIMAEFFLQQKFSSAGLNIVRSVSDTSEIREVIERTFRRISITDEIVENAGSSDCDWLVFSIGRYTDAYGCDESFGDVEAYKGSLCGYVSRKYSENGGLHRNKATEWHRIALTLLACGGNPEVTVSGSVGDVRTINLIADGTYDCVIGKPWRQGLNGAIYALITLDSVNYIIPDGAAYSRNDIVNYIISQELETGGFSLAGNNSGVRYDIDVTAMAIQALSKYYDSRDDVRQTVDRSLECLSGGFGKDASYGNASSTAQVLLALTSVGIDVTEDERFITEDGRNIIDGIMDFYDEDESMFCLTKKSGPIFMATTQCLYALTGWCRQADGFSLLFDFGITGQPEKPETPPDTGNTQRPDTTRKPDTGQGPETTTIPVSSDVGQGPYTKPNYMQSQKPFVIEEEKEVEKIKVRKKDKTKNAKKKTVKLETDKLKTHGKKTVRLRTDNSKTDREKNVKLETDNLKTDRDKTFKPETGSTKTDSKKTAKINMSNSETSVSNKFITENSGDRDGSANNIIIDRDEAYITEQELGRIKGTDSNILIDSLFDDAHRCFITINGGDVDTCSYMNLKASAGSGNTSDDREIMEMASGAFIFNVAEDNGIVCDALYSIETSLPPGEYLLMRYVGGGADCVDKVEVSEGYLRFVIDTPGVYFVCSEVKVKAGSALTALAVEADTGAGVWTERYTVLALMAAAAAVCSVIIIRRKKNVDDAH